MGNFVKAGFLLCFSVMLALAGIGERSGISSTHTVGAEQVPVRVAQGEQLKFQFFQRATGETIVGSAQSLPSPTPENNRIAFLPVSLAREHNMQRRARHYFLYAKTICCSLASTRIIFPFHYFW